MKIAATWYLRVAVDVFLFLSVVACGSAHGQQRAEPPPGQKSDTPLARQPSGTSRTSGPPARLSAALKDLLYSRCTEGEQRLWDVLSNAPMRRMFEQGETRYGWPWLATRFDADRNGTVSRREFLGSDEQFRQLDRDQNQLLTAADFDWSARSPLLNAALTGSQILNVADVNSNGRISAEEWSKAFEKLAADKGYVTQDDLQLLLSSPGRPSTGDSQLQSQRLKTFTRGESVYLFHEAPHVGVVAPDFVLWTHDRKEQARLSQYRGKKPVVLIFGSFTCPPYRVQTAVLEDMYRRYGDRAAFFAIYLREAHPTDGWRSEANDKIGLAIQQPLDMAGRQAAAGRFCSALDLRMPVLVDEMDDRVARAYNAKPNRLILVDRQGDVAYRSAAGPFGFNPPDLEQSLILTLLDEEQSSATRGEPANQSMTKKYSHVNGQPRGAAASQSSDPSRHR